MYEIYKRLLEERNVTTADVCKATGISQSTMSNWKKRNNALSVKNAQKVADYFGVTIEYLLYGKMYTSDESEQTSAQSTYYNDPETAKVAQAVFSDPNLRLLFDAAEDCSPDQVLLAAEMLKKFKEGR